MLGTKVDHCVQLLFSAIFPYSWREMGTFHRFCFDEGSTSVPPIWRDVHLNLHLIQVCHVTVWLLGHMTVKKRPDENRSAQVKTRQRQIRHNDLPFTELTLCELLFIEARTGQRGHWCLVNRWDPCSHWHTILPLLSITGLLHTLN